MVRPRFVHASCTLALGIIPLIALLATGCGQASFSNGELQFLADQLGSASAAAIVAGETATTDESAGKDDEESGSGTALVLEDGAEEATDGDSATNDGNATGTGTSEPDDAIGPEGPDAPIHGVYVLGFEGRPYAYLYPYLENPKVDGFSLRADWADLEPVEGEYDWSLFDAVIPYAALFGKRVMLRVLPGTRSPEWLYAAGAARYSYLDDDPDHSTYGELVSMPVPWDPVFLGKWSDFVTAMGAHYGDHPAVTIVAVTGPSAGGEMHLGDKDNAAGWHAAGYTRTRLANAWRDTIDIYRAAFPTQHLTVAIANPVSFDDPWLVVDSVAAYCADVGCGLQGNWLAAKTDPDSALYLHVAAHGAITPVGFQMLCSATLPRFGGTLRAAVDLALDANTTFLELYKLDITAFPGTVAYAHDQIEQAASP